MASATRALTEYLDLVPGSGMWIGYVVGYLRSNFERSFAQGGLALATILSGVAGLISVTGQ
jgi:hypothetical protein